MAENNNLNDFDDEYADPAAVQRPRAAKPTVKGNLAAAWQGSPLFKLFVLVVIVGALAAAIIGLLLSGGDKDIAGMNVRGAPGISEVAGAKAPPAYVDAVNDASQKRADEAVKQGASAIPTPVSGDVTTATPNPEDEESQYDPLAEFRPTVPQEGAPAPNPDDLAAESVDPDLLAKMQAQMNTLFEAWRPEGIKVVQVIDPSTLKKDVGEKTPVLGKGDRVIVPSGTISYAQLLIEANSDAPGPVLAEIMSGPLAGGRAIGQFEVTREYLILRFSKITYKKKEYATDAVALDPNSTLPGMVTEKDNRYFTRLVLPMAAGFLEGFGSAISAPSNRVVTDSGSVVVFQQSKQGVKDGIYRGISEAANTAGGFFRDEASATKPLIRVAAGTPMGLFFVNPVTEGSQNGMGTGGTFSNAIPLAPSSTGPSTTTQMGTTTITETEIRPNLSGGSQSSLANGGLNIIQTNPK